MVEWLERKPCWLGKRGSELNSGCRRRSKTSTQICWFTGFGNSDYCCVFVKVGEVLKS